MSLQAVEKLGKNLGITGLLLELLVSRVLLRLQLPREPSRISHLSH